MVEGLGPPVQIAYAVPDVVAAADRFAQRFGAGPFFVRSHIELAEVAYRGRPGVFDHSSAYGQWGGMMVELVQDHGAGPSPVRDLYGPDESGLHHLAFFVEDLDRAVDRLAGEGYEVALRAVTPGGIEMYFVDTVARYGHMLELYRPSDHLRAFYTMVAGAAQGWDGSDPVRR
jgi:catechol 2,3-dioxygenase-like lactoylglutathione lyase family enzyme